jgi:hypothetical protein
LFFSIVHALLRLGEREIESEMREATMTERVRVRESLRESVTESER